jgi:hypothetical protein
VFAAPSALLPVQQVLSHVVATLGGEKAAEPLLLDLAAEHADAACAAVNVARCLVMWLAAAAGRAGVAAGPAEGSEGGGELGGGSLLPRWLPALSQLSGACLLPLASLLPDQGALPSDPEYLSVARLQEVLGHALQLLRQLTKEPTL